MLRQLKTKPKPLFLNKKFFFEFECIYWLYDFICYTLVCAIDGKTFIREKLKPEVKWFFSYFAKSDGEEPSKLGVYRFSKSILYVKTQLAACAIVISGKNISKLEIKNDMVLKSLFILNDILWFIAILKYFMLIMTPGIPKWKKSPRLERLLLLIICLFSQNLRFGLWAFNSSPALYHMFGVC